jgi:hypothetical protein
VNPDDTTEAGMSSGGPEQGGAPQRRQLSFRTSGLTVDLEITGVGESRRLAGRLIPGQSAVVEIRGVITAQADASGRFTAIVPPGRVDLRCRLGAEADHARIATGWVAL